MPDEYQILVLSGPPGGNHLEWDPTPNLEEWAQTHAGGGWTFYHHEPTVIPPKLAGSDPRIGWICFARRPKREDDGGEPAVAGRCGGTDLYPAEDFGELPDRMAVQRRGYT